jgi:hypothetical protein
MVEAQVSAAPSKQEARAGQRAVRPAGTQTGARAAAAGFMAEAAARTARLASRRAVAAAEAAAAVL